jgi:hypothetical protein
MTSEDALKLLLSRLDECGIPYMITGSFASNIHGLPRAAQDADVVIEVEPGGGTRNIGKISRKPWAKKKAGIKVQEKPLPKGDDDGIIEIRDQRRGHPFKRQDRLICHRPRLRI